MSDLQQANQLMERARKKIQAVGCGCFGGSYDSKASSAISMFSKAIIIFQRESQYSSAGICFEEIASIKERLGEDPYEEYQEAAYCYSFVDKKKSSEIMQKCCKSYELKGQFNKSGDVFEKMAQYYEEEKNYENAAALYEKAANNYALVSSGYKSKEKNCRLKSYDITTIHNVGNWKEAAEGYSNIGKSYLLEPMLKYNAKELFFKVVCLYLIHDVRKIIYL